MPEITYQRSFEHQDWRDGEDIVQAGGETGFNQKFHAIEDELDRIGDTFSTVSSEIQAIQRLRFIMAQSNVSLAANTSSEEFNIETYDRSGLPENIERIYTAVIFPTGGSTNIQHTFLYSPLPGNRMDVSVKFFNLGSNQAIFNFRIFTLAI